MAYFIDVILPIPIEKLFTYSINASEFDFLQRGMRVAVPFGKTKIYTGIVYKVHKEAPLAYEAKEIHQILDDSPIVNQNQFELWRWMASYYMCTLGDVMRAALPNAFILESETVIRLNTDKIINEIDLKDDEFLVYEALQHQSSLKIHDISNILDKKTVLPVINRLIKKEAIFIEEEVYEKYKPKLVRYVKLHTQFTSEKALQALLEDLSRAPKQSQVILSLFSISAKTKKPIKVSDLVTESKVTSNIIKALIDKKILEEYYIETDRVHYSGNENEDSKQLNKFQIKALHEIKESFTNQSVTLLHGVTSSGKTEIYVKLIQDQI